MNPAPGSAFCEPQLAAMPQLREKPRQGFETWKTTRKPGSNSCNFTVALGLRATVVENGVRETYRARYYNPATGRFLSEDPIGFAGSGPNLYAYAENNPISLKDALGLCPNYCSALPGIADQSNLAAKTIALFAALLLLTAWMFAFVAIIGMSMMFLGLIVAVFAEMGQIATNLSHQSPCKQ
jgi:RHS repeat-associated protein